MTDFNKPTIITKRNIDSNQNPISIKLLEKRQIMDNHSCVVLSQIPDESYRVQIEGLTEIFNQDELTENAFYVSYNEGVVYFHPRYNGKVVVIEYYGIGYEVISASRVFYKYSTDGTFIETLEEILDRTKLQFELIEKLGNAVQIIEKLDIDITTGQTLHDNLENDITVGTPLQESLNADIAEAKKWKDQLHTDVVDGKVLQPILHQDVVDARDIKTKLDKSVEDAQDDIATIEATGNETKYITSNQWVLNSTSKMYEYTLTHQQNSKALTISCYNTDTDEFVFSGGKILDKNRILFENETAINLTVVINSRYYKPQMTASSEVIEEVAEARKGKVDLKTKITEIDDKIASNTASLETMEKKTDDTLYIDFFKCDDGKYVQGDGIHDDTTGIQRALNFAIKNKYRKISALREKYFVTSTVILPFAFVGYPLDCDFNGATFLGNDNENLLIFDGGVLDKDGNAVSTWGSANEQYLTETTILHNFRLENASKGLRIRNWIYGCKIYDYVTYNVRTVIHTQRCFYSIFENITPSVSNDFTIRTGDSLYLFEDNNNIMPLKSLRLCACDIGYKFTGAIESLTISDTGVEKCNVGIDIQGVCYNLNIDSCYFESPTKCIRIGASVQSLDIDNCWFYSTSTKYIFEVTSTGSMQNLKFKKNNIITGYKFFETAPTRVITGEIELQQGMQSENKTYNINTFISDNNIPKGICVYNIVSNYKSASGLNSTFAISKSSNRQLGIQSGQFLGGYVNAIPLCEFTKTTNDAIFNTSIIHSETQLVYVNIKIARTSGYWYAIGFIQGSTFYEFGNATASTKLTITKDSNGYMIISALAISNDGNMNLAGGQIMLLG